MSDVTQLLERIETGDHRATDELLPLVYKELRRLAGKQLAGEAPGQSLQSADLVHEAYLRLLGANQDWDCRGHFFAAAAEAMRRILVENARRKARVKHGGDFERQEVEPGQLLAADSEVDMLALDDALDRLAASDSQAAELVKLRYFAGLTIPQAAEILAVSPRKADLLWSFARAWLRRELDGSR
jgi:RNA polymerase sigma factor (TIGR02999 family)